MRVAKPAHRGDFAAEPHAHYLRIWRRHLRAKVDDLNRKLALDIQRLRLIDPRRRPARAAPGNQIALPQYLAQPGVVGALKRRPSFCGRVALTVDTPRVILKGDGGAFQAKVSRLLDRRRPPHALLTRSDRKSVV